MARITFDQEYEPKPTGVLEADIIGLECRNHSDPLLPNTKYLRDKSNMFVLILKVRPFKHDREYDIHIPVKLAYAEDGMLDLKNSKGIKDINGTLLEGLGFKKAGFNAKGAFEDEQENIIQEDDIPIWLHNEIMAKHNFKVVVFIYKVEGTGEYKGKHFFRCSRFIYPNTEAGKASALKGLNKQFEYLEKTNAAAEPQQAQTQQAKRTI